MGSPHVDMRLGSSTRHFVCAPTRVDTHGWLPWKHSASPRRAIRDGLPREVVIRAYPPTALLAALRGAVPVFDRRSNSDPQSAHCSIVSPGMLMLASRSVSDSRFAARGLVQRRVRYRVGRVRGHLVGSAPASTRSEISARPRAAPTFSRAGAQRSHDEGARVTTLVCRAASCCLSSTLMHHYDSTPQAARQAEIVTWPKINLPASESHVLDIGHEQRFRSDASRNEPDRVQAEAARKGLSMANMATASQCRDYFAFRPDAGESRPAPTASTCQSIWEDYGRPAIRRHDVRSCRSNGQTSESGHRHALLEAFIFLASADIHVHRIRTGPGYRIRPGAAQRLPGVLATTRPAAAAE